MKKYILGFGVVLKAKVHNFSIVFENEVMNKLIGTGLEFDFED